MARRARRKVAIARRDIDALGLATGTPTLFDPLATWNTDLGMVKPPPMCTIAGIRFQLAVRAETAAKTAVEVDIGFLVGPDTLDAADASARTTLHLDWMATYRFLVPNLGAVGETQRCGGLGDEGYTTIRTKRKLQEISEQLWMAYEVNYAGSGTVALLGRITTAVMLP